MSHFRILLSMKYQLQVHMIVSLVTDSFHIILVDTFQFSGKL